MILGGVAPLAGHLEVAESVLRTWLDGTEEPTESAFLSAVEIILLDADAGPGRAA